MEPFELSPMAMIQAQRDRIVALIDENVQLTAAVAMLQQQLAGSVPIVHADDNGEVDEVELDPDAREYIKDVTDQVVGAEMDPRAELTS